MYLKMQEDLSVQMIAGSVSSKTGAHQMFKNMDTMKIDRVYDMLIKKGIGSSLRPLLIYYSVQGPLSNNQNKIKLYIKL